ncbi:hypothetical protein CN378_13945 [Bacillus sp. AFS015802]|uniref:competence protein CoiA n=1 Tax=Bacillus sp. AFS015802 TaxID=2033486 RepID=UPI000BF4AFE0|nr:competence protein CoiA family protein [Bacillus sp. AFS015802]PFA66395.1 hypothetical protein CN378_13945 [Bacillus sp. AFS015802]
MLTALFNQQAFTTIHYSREELKVLRSKGHAFHCPHCSSRLRLRIGSQNIPHFAHVSHSDCEVVKHESPEHLLGKQLLYDRINSLYTDVKLEHYVKELKQIADIYVKTATREIAIEIQCSTIPLPEIQNRTRGYHSRKIIPFWILTQPVKYNDLLTLSSFQQSFIRYSPHLDYHLLQFLPEKGSFQLFHHLLPLTASTFMSPAPITIPLGRFTLPPSIPDTTFHQPYQFKNWNYYRTKWIYNKLHYQQPRKDGFLREVYGSGDTFLYLPLYIGLPLIPHGIHIKNHVVEWQYYIWKDCLKRDRFFSEESVYMALNRRLTKGHIELRPLPFVKEDEVMMRIARGYVWILEEMKVLSRVSKNQFQLSEPWSCPDHFSAFEQHREDFFPVWKHILKKL